ncbi:MAG: TraL conjugative transposon family protein [Bacteroidales bacterium]|jgi:hypothetical protein|nr:TraL conjugative transposon family protein [Bacteroidales bacterium]
MKKITGEIRENADNRLRSMCDRLSPERRFAAVVAALSVFAVLAVYTAVGSIFYMERPEIDMEHMQGLKLRQVDNDNDSINALKFKNDEYDE